MYTNKRVQARSRLEHNGTLCAAAYSFPLPVLLPSNVFASPNFHYALISFKKISAFFMKMLIFQSFFLIFIKTGNLRIM